MAKNTIPRGDTSVIRHVFIQDSASATGAGKTGLTFETASLTAYYIYAGGTATALTLETISTLGTYAAPTSNAHMRFKEVDATNMPGWYELHFHNDWFSVASARKTACVQLKGAAGMAQLNLEIDVIGMTIQSATPDVNTYSITADAITAASINTGAFTADAFAADAIVAATLATGCLTADAFAADAIVAATLATDCITDDAIATGAIASTAFAAGAIDATAIANNAIDAATFAADMDAEIATIVWNAATASYGGAGTYGQAVEDILADTNELQADDYPTSIAAVKTVVDLIEDIHRNEVVIVDATGAVSLKNDAGVEMLTGSVTDNAGTTTRTRLA